MSEFEDNLWLSVVREHGDELARTGRTVHKHRRAPRPRLLAGSTVGLAATATAAALLLGASTSSPAFAVTRNPDGTVTVNLMKLSGIAGANERLAAMGVRAQIRALAKQPPKFVCPGGTVPTITFDPASIPKRQALVITPSRPSSGDAAASKADTGNGSIGSTGSGDTGSGAISGGGNNHVVRMYSGGGKIRMQSGGGSNHVVRMSCP
jgi:hypothetical protein